MGSRSNSRTFLGLTPQALCFRLLRRLSEPEKSDMTTKFKSVVLVLVLAVTAFAQNPPPANGKKPNIVFILADNLGYGVPSSYNGGILDAPLAREY